MRSAGPPGIRPAARLVPVAAGAPAMVPETVSGVPRVRSSAAPLALLLLLPAALLERRTRTVSRFWRLAADRLAAHAKDVSAWFLPPARIDLGELVLGLVLLAVMLYGIAAFHFDMQTVAVRAVTGLPTAKSAALAFSLILLTVLCGILLHLSAQMAAGRPGRVGRPIFVPLSVLLAFIAVGMAIFQGGLYFELFRQTAGGLMPALGAAAYFLIALVEAAGFFVITVLLVENMGGMATRLAPTPLVLTAAACRLLQRLFECVPGPPLLIGGSPGTAALPREEKKS
jgi:hypothetical protein